jgi:nucleoid-associated protein YgaU
MEMRIHTVKYGDTLETISQKYFQQTDRALIIYQHNRHYIQNPNLLYAGQELCIPYISPHTVVT